MSNTMTLRVALNIYLDIKRLTSKSYTLALIWIFKYKWYFWSYDEKLNIVIIRFFKKLSANR